MYILVCYVLYIYMHIFIIYMYTVICIICLIYVCRAIRAAGIDCIISIDTRRAVVAANAIAAGADLINDVSGEYTWYMYMRLHIYTVCTLILIYTLLCILLNMLLYTYIGGAFDPAILTVAVKTGTPMAYMHMRGLPQTMTQTQYTTYTDDIIDTVATELTERLRVGEAIGVPRWMQIVDPGIGFAKTACTSAYLLRPESLRGLRKALGGRLMMVGLSRKRFLETLLQV